MYVFAPNAKISRISNVSSVSVFHSPSIFSIVLICEYGCFLRLLTSNKSNFCRKFFESVTKLAVLKPNIIKFVSV